MLLRPALVCGLLALSSIPADAPAIWAGIESGPHLVGATRTKDAGQDVTSWYPASSGGRAARLRDFSEQASGLVAALVGAGVDAKIANGYVDSVLASRWDATPAKGKWPLVLIAQGNQQDAFDQAVLAEIVASHGFVVATVPSPTIKTPMKSADDVGPFAQRQAEDLLSAVAALTSAGHVDTTRIAMVGHSFGARAALLLAMHDARVKGLVSLDGGIGTSTAQESFKTAKWFSRERGTVPVLHFYETLDEVMTPDFSLLRSLPALRLTLREVKGLHHSHFTTIGFEAAVEPAIGQLTRMGLEGRSSLRVMITEAVGFLSEQLR